MGEWNAIFQKADWNIFSPSDKLQKKQPAKNYY